MLKIKNKNIKEYDDYVILTSEESEQDKNLIYKLVQSGKICFIQLSKKHYKLLKDKNALKNIGIFLSPYISVKYSPDKSFKEFIEYINSNLENPFIINQFLSGE
jgi:hypothetical protein